MSTALYETDFYAWTQHQAELLRNEDYAGVDLPNLIEEIESMGNSQRNQLGNRLRILITHLLKLRQQATSHPARGWRLTVREQRRRLNSLLKNSPSLRRELQAYADEAYAEAREDAADAMGIAIAELPIACPWTVEQLLDLDWLP